MAEENIESQNICCDEIISGIGLTMAALEAQRAQIVQDIQVKLGRFEGERQQVDEWSSCSESQMQVGLLSVAEVHRGSVGQLPRPHSHSMLCAQGRTKLTIFGALHFRQWP